MEKFYPDDFDYVVEHALKVPKPCRIAIAGADNENITEGAFLAQEAGFGFPVLIGDADKIKAVLTKIGRINDKYEIQSVPSTANVVQYAIDMVKNGYADILMRGNTETRDFLLPILNKSNHLLLEDKILTHVVLLKLPFLKKPIALSDVTICVKPSPEMKKEIIKNMVRFLKLTGITDPNIAILSLVETPSFHMRDSVEAAGLVMEQEEEPFAKCNLVGPIPYDLIMSKEAARLKGFDCPYCGDFDGIIVPDLMTGNVMCKILERTEGASSFGVIMGANIPVSITSRSGSKEEAFMSLAASAVMSQRGKNKK